MFLSIESSGGTSLLSKYSTSGLLKESQTDVDSSIETEFASDLLGETSMLQETGTAAAMAGALVFTFSSLLGKDVTLQGTGTTVLVFPFEGAGKKFPEMLVLALLAAGAFLALASLVEHGTFRHEILLMKTSKRSIMTLSSTANEISWYVNALCDKNARSKNR